MTRRLIYILPVVVFVVVAVVLFRSLFTTPATLILKSTLLNQPAPKIELAALDDQTQGFGPKALAAGHVSLVNVFGSWCAECHIEAPVLMQLAQMAEANNFEIYGMVSRDTPAKIRAFLAQTGNPFSRIGNDVDGKVGIEWGVYGAPETFVVDGKGVIRYKYVGALTQKVVAEELMPAIKAAQSS